MNLIHLNINIIYKKDYIHQGKYLKIEVIKLNKLKFCCYNANNI